MNNEAVEKGNKEISISVLFSVLKSALIWILIATIIGGILGCLYSLAFQKTKYTATVEFNVVNALSSNEYTSDSMLSAASRIATTCVEIAEKNVLHKAVVESGNIDALLNCTKEDAIKKVSTLITANKANEESQIFSVTVSSDNITLTHALIKAIQTEMPVVAAEITTSNADSQNAAVLKVVTEVLGDSSVKTVRPSAFRNALIFALAAFVLAYAVFFVVYILDTKVYDEASIKENFSTPIIGTIPAWYTIDERAMSKKKLMQQHMSISSRHFKEKLITSKATPFAVAESFNTLRTNLLYSVPASKCPVFVVTSDFSAAGKSLVSSNLAISLALLGKKVLAIEGDMRCPDFTKIFGKKDSFGLSELLSGNASSASDVIVKGVHENLDIIYAGHTPPNPTELLSSPRMQELVAEWKQVYDIIIIDTPPILEVVDAGVLSSFVNGYIIVARSGHSDVKAISEALGFINGVNGNIIGFVINAVNIKYAGEYGMYGKYSKYEKYKKYHKYEAAAMQSRNLADE